jgi:hypothetical protein
MFKMNNTESFADRSPTVTVKGKSQNGGGRWLGEQNLADGSTE